VLLAADAAAQSIVPVTLQTIAEPAVATAAAAAAALVALGARQTGVTRTLSESAVAAAVELSVTAPPSALRPPSSSTIASDASSGPQATRTLSPSEGTAGRTSAKEAEGSASAMTRRFAPPLALPAAAAAAAAAYAAAVVASRRSAVETAGGARTARASEQPAGATPHVRGAGVTEGVGVIEGVRVAEGVREGVGVAETRSGTSTQQRWSPTAS
jgi:cytoskeletal protein RodZ